MMNEKLSSIMTTDIITVHPNDDLSHVRSIFKTNAIHHLPVVKYKTLVGIITTGDLWYSELAPKDYAHTKVETMMTTKMATLEPQEKIGIAAELFLENRFHAVPIIENDELVGLVTSFDVMKYQFKKEYPMQEVH